MMKLYMITTSTSRPKDTIHIKKKINILISHILKCLNGNGKKRDARSMLKKNILVNNFLSNHKTLCSTFSFFFLFV